jgi:hypothetical protein
MFHFLLPNRWAPALLVFIPIIEFPLGLRIARTNNLLPAPKLSHNPALLPVNSISRGSDRIRKDQLHFQQQDSR